MPARISFKNLKAFLTLAQECNVSRAALRMNIAQPALSQQIHLLENRLAVVLFERRTRPLHLTAAGKYLQTEIARLVERFENAVAEAREIENGHKGWLGVGFTRSAMYGYLPPIVQRFAKLHPMVELKLYEMLTEEQPEALRAGKIHVGIARDPDETSEFRQEILLREGLVIALSPRHRLAKRRSLRMIELADEAFILFPKHPQARFPSRIRALCHEAGFDPRVVQETYEIQTALGLVAAGLGISVVTAAIAKQGRNDLVFRPLRSDGTAAAQTMLAAVYRNEPSWPLLGELLALLHDGGDRK